MKVRVHHNPKSLLSTTFQFSQPNKRDKPVKTTSKHKGKVKRNMLFSLKHVFLKEACMCQRNESKLIAEAQWRQTIRQRLSGDTTLLYCMFSFLSHGNLSSLITTQSYTVLFLSVSGKEKKDGKEGEESRRKWRKKHALFQMWAWCYKEGNLRRQLIVFV